MNARSRVAAAAVIFAATLTVTVAASDHSPTVQAAGVELVVSPSSALVDQSVNVRLTGLRAGRRVTLEATTLDFLKKRWRSQLVVRASRAA